MYYTIYILQTHTLSRMDKKVTKSPKFDAAKYGILEGGQVFFPAVKYGRGTVMPWACFSTNSPENSVRVHEINYSLIQDSQEFLQRENVKEPSICVCSNLLQQE
ncbi:hypothetical protein GOODEAATRI_023799 [Goodea atripinnis]|uniref:Uncharacterized protein n=1 Tax=Goodea atripinnis TaxID=208336 RepID=A0ABV0Q171_9TELE